MSQNIINPDRRDPSRIRNRADIGLSHVDNVGVSEILDLAKDLTKDEVCRGDRYAEQELINGVNFEIPLCNFTSESTKVSITVSFLHDDVVYSIVTARVFHTYNSSVSDRFIIEFDLVGNIVLSDSNLVSFYFYEDSSAKQANLSIVCDGNSLNNNYGITSISYHFSDYVVVSGDKSDVPGFTKLTQTSIRIGDDQVGNLMSGDNIKRQIYNLRFSDRKLSSFTRSLPVYNETSSDKSLVYDDCLVINEDSKRNSYNFPTINNVIFTGSKGISVFGNNPENSSDKSTRNITITAKHSGTDLGSAGRHDWDVLDNIPVNTNDGVKYQKAGEINNGAGLCTLVSDKGNQPNKDSNLAIQNKIISLKNWTDSLSSNQSASVITVDFLKTYTEVLSNILTDLTINSAETSVFFGKPNIKENSVITLEGSVYSYLGTSPTPHKFVIFGIKTVLPNNKTIKIHFEEDEDNPYELDVIDYPHYDENDSENTKDFPTEITKNNKSLTFTTGFISEGSSLSKTEIRAFKIITTEKLDYSKDYLSGKSFKLKVSSIKTTDGDEEILEELVSIDVKQRILDNTNSIFLNLLTDNYSTVPVFSSTVFTRILYLNDSPKEDTISTNNIKSLVPSNNERKQTVASSLFKNIYSLNGLLNKKFIKEVITSGENNEEILNTDYEVLLPPTSKKDIIVEGFSVYPNFNFEITCNDNNPVDTISFYTFNNDGTSLKQIGDEIVISGSECSNKIITVDNLFNVSASAEKEELFDYAISESSMSWEKLETINSDSTSSVFYEDNKDNQTFFIKIKPKNNSNLVNTENSGSFVVTINQGTQKTTLNLKQRCCPYIISVPDNYNKVWSYGLSSPQSFCFERKDTGFRGQYIEKNKINNQYNYLLNILLVKLNEDKDGVHCLSNINNLSKDKKSPVEIVCDNITINTHINNPTGGYSATQDFNLITPNTSWPAKLYCYKTDNLDNSNYSEKHDRTGLYLILKIYEDIDINIGSKNSSYINNITLSLSEKNLDINHFEKYNFIYPPEILPFELTNFKQEISLSNNESTVEMIGEERRGFIGLQEVGGRHYPQRRNTISFHLTYMGLAIAVPDFNQSRPESWGWGIFPIAKTSQGQKICRIGTDDPKNPIPSWTDDPRDTVDSSRILPWDLKDWWLTEGSAKLTVGLGGGWGYFNSKDSNYPLTDGPQYRKGQYVYLRLSHYIARVGCGYEISPSFDVNGDSAYISIESTLTFNNNDNKEEYENDSSSDYYKFTTNYWNKYNENKEGESNYFNFWTTNASQLGDDLDTPHTELTYMDRVKSRNCSTWRMTRNVQLKNLKKNYIYNRPLGRAETFEDPTKSCSENWDLLLKDNGPGLAEIEKETNRPSTCPYDTWTKYDGFYEKYLDRMVFFPEKFDDDGKPLADISTNKIGLRDIDCTPFHYSREKDTGAANKIGGLEEYIPRLKYDAPTKPLDMTLTLRFYYYDGNLKFPIDVQGTCSDCLDGIMESGVFNNELIYKFTCNPGQG